ncbi:hypothetical protein BT69DRAFT_1300763 [Atractiella rhizophila]|nr:hypothetical protein BT69DRAFT_1300763 [Atractiella rhizophila]
MNLDKLVFIDYAEKNKGKNLEEQAQHWRKNGSNTLSAATLSQYFKDKHKIRKEADKSENLATKKDTLSLSRDLQLIRPVIPIQGYPWKMCHALMPETYREAVLRDGPRRGYGFRNAIHPWDWSIRGIMSVDRPMEDKGVSKERGGIEDWIWYEAGSNCA